MAEQDKLTVEEILRLIHLYERQGRTEEANKLSELANSLNKKQPQRAQDADGETVAK